MPNDITQNHSLQRPRTPSKAELMLFSDAEIIDFCVAKDGNWLRVPSEKINDDVIAAVINAHPRGILIIYKYDTALRAQHIDASLLKWKSKALQRLQNKDIPRDEALIIAAISDDPSFYKHLPRESKKGTVIDAALAADINLYNETPSNQITEHHILMVIEQAPSFLSNRSKNPNCALSESVIDRILEIDAGFLRNPPLQRQLNKQQLIKLANCDSLFWGHNILPLAETLQLMQMVLALPTHGEGADKLKHIIRNNKEISVKGLISCLRQPYADTPTYLMALDILNHDVFAKHVKAYPELLEYYQAFYGSEAAIQLSGSSKMRRDILCRDLDI
jgi:hypothetical protein